MGLENGKIKKDNSVIGKRFGSLVVKTESRTGGRSYCECVCDCGNTKTVRRNHLLSGATRSCGCYLKENTRVMSRTHGMSRTRIYRIWKGMKNRCCNENIPQYSDWGGRGITVCDEWKHDFKSFYEWAVNNGYDEKLSIDRIDNNEGYCPENCRWVTEKEQALNRRSNVYITHNGVTKHISEWDVDIGVKKSGRVRARLNAGWNISDAVTTHV